MSTASAFLVPSMALESMSPRVAAGRFVRFVRKDTANFFAFVGMRMLMGIAGYFALMISYEIVLLMVMVVFGLLGTLVGLLLHAVGVPVERSFPAWDRLFLCVCLPLERVRTVLRDGHLLHLL